MDGKYQLDNAQQQFTLNILHISPHIALSKQYIHTSIVIE